MHKNHFTSLTHEYAHIDCVPIKAKVHLLPNELTMQKCKTNQVSVGSTLIGLKLVDLKSIVSVTFSVFFSKLNIAQN